MECRGSAGWFKKGRRVSGRACPVKDAARSPAGIGASVACARRGEGDDPDAWARPGSEGKRTTRLGAARGAALLGCGAGPRERGGWLLAGRAGEGSRLGWCGLLGPEGRSGPPGWAERGEREKCCGLGLKQGWAAHGFGLGWLSGFLGLGLGFPSLFLVFSLLSSFLFKPHSTNLNSNSNLNSTLQHSNKQNYATA